MTNIIPSINVEVYLANHKLDSGDKKSTKPLSRKGYSELSERLFGKIKSSQPLNCKNPKCGSKNLRYTKGKACHAIQAWCNDCTASFPVAKSLAPHLQHLVEPECPPKKIICKHCGNSAEVIDSQYYQCWNCAGRITKFDINSE